MRAQYSLPPTSLRPVLSSPVLSPRISLTRISLTLALGVTALGVSVGSVQAKAQTPPNTPPIIESVGITPIGPHASDSLACIALATDAEGDALSFRYQWTIDNTPMPGAVHDTIAGVFARGQTVRCEATAYDGALLGESMASAPIMIENAPPAVVHLRVEPDLAQANLALHCAEMVVDPDGDSIEQSYQWMRDGQPLVGQTDSILPVGVARRGDHISCEISATDQATEVVVQSAEVAVRNAPPTIDLVLLIETPVGMRCAADAQDADADDIGLRFAWTVNGVLTSIDGALLDVPVLRGDTVQCSVIAHDAVSDSAIAQGPSFVMRKDMPRLMDESLSLVIR